MNRLLLFADDQVSPDITMSDNGSCFDPIWNTGQAINPRDYDLTRLEFVCETLPLGRLTDYAVSDMGCPVL